MNGDFSHFIRYREDFIGELDKLCRFAAILNEILAIFSDLCVKFCNQKFTLALRLSSQKLFSLSRSQIEHSFRSTTNSCVGTKTQDISRKMALRHVLRLSISNLATRSLNVSEIDLNPFSIVSNLTNFQYFFLANIVNCSIKIIEFPLIRSFPRRSTAS